MKMTSRERAELLEQRLIDFAVRVVKMAEKLPNGYVYAEPDALTPLIVENNEFISIFGATTRTVTSKQKGKS